MIALVLSLTVPNADLASSSSLAAASMTPADQAARPASSDADKCPLRAADLDKLTPYRWQFGQYKTDRVFVPNGTIRIDYCELIGMDQGRMRTGVMVNIATGANAEAFAKHWHAACADSIQAEARGKVQPVPGVPGGQQCVTANGGSSHYWIESPGRTIQVEAETTDAALAKIFPQVLAAAAR
jgi:hypothetical protein